MHCLRAPCTPLQILGNCRVPCREMMYVTKKLAMVADSLSGIAAASGHLVNASIAVTIYLLPLLETGNGPIRSM